MPAAKGSARTPLGPILSDINLGLIEDDPNYNFKNKFDEDNEVFAENMHSCGYGRDEKPILKYE